MLDTDISGEKKMIHHNEWLPIAIIIMIVEAGLEAYALIRLFMLNMLPDRYLLVIALIMVLSLLVTGMLLFMGMKHHRHHKARSVRRVIGVILAVVFGFGSAYASSMAHDVQTTVASVTDETKTVEAVVGVYVMADDSAQTIDDAKDYQFAVMRSFDLANTRAAENTLANMLGQTLNLSEFASITDCARALYDGRAGAMLVNEAFAATLEDVDEYADFATDTRLLYEVSVDTPAEVTDPALTASASTSTSEAVASGSFSIPEDALDAVSDVTSKPFVLYVSGSDTRSQILDTSRSDVNIIMAVNPTTKQILLLNTPRDYYIANPVGGGALDKLTHCGIYGVDCSMKALANLYDTDVNYYLQLNFTGFETLIDAIGGITINSPQDFTASQTSSYSFKKGANQVNGAQALAFARERYSFASGDNQRGRDQMEVIRAVIEKLTSSPAILQNYSQILQSMENMMVTSMTSNDISALVKMQLTDGSSWDIKRFAVTGTGGSDVTYSMPGVHCYVMYPNDDDVAAAKALLDKIENGETITDDDADFVTQ